MSRKGKIPIGLVKDVKVTLTSGLIHMDGPKGKLDLKIPAGINVEKQEEKLLVKRDSDTKQARANQGSIRAHLANMMTGVTKGHKKDLELYGLGFRAQLKGKKIEFNLGLSHPVEFDVPEGIKVVIPNQTSISLEGPSIEVIGSTAARIRALKPAEPYKGKGFRYAGEVIRRKQGKSVTK